MNGLVRDVLSTLSSSTINVSARLTNFNPDKILFIVSSEQPVTKSDLAKILLTMNFKNSVGSGIAVTANLPLDFVANMSDYFYGFGLLGSDNTACFVLDIGKYCLRSDDEITFSISTFMDLDHACALSVKALDTRIGKEQLISYKYVSAFPNQSYQEANVLTVFGQIPTASDSVFITTDDFFGSNNLSELAVVGMGSALGNAEDVDDFGLIWNDDTNLTQPVTVHAGSPNEKILFKIWNFDVNRIGFEKTEYNSARLLAKSIADGNPSKAKCLRYFYG